MATLTATKIIEGGVTGAETGCATGGDEFANTGVEFIRVHNYHASQNYTVRVTAQTTSFKHQTYGALTKPNVDYTIAATGESGAAGAADKSIYMGPFKQSAFSDANNKVQITYRTGATYASGSTLNASAGTHKLKIEVLYLDNS